MTLLVPLGPRLLLSGLVVVVGQLARSPVHLAV